MKSIDPYLTESDNVVQNLANLVRAPFLDIYFILLTIL